MTKVGIQDWLRRAILMDEFADLRDTGAIQWVFYTQEAVTGFMEKGKGNGWIHHLGSLQVAKESA
jgi:hypothetical protein